MINCVSCAHVELVSLHSKQVECLHHSLDKPDAAIKLRSHSWNHQWLGQASCSGMIKELYGNWFHKATVSIQDSIRAASIILSSHSFSLNEFFVSPWFMCAVVYKLKFSLGYPE